MHPRIKGKESEETRREVEVWRGNGMKWNGRKREINIVARSRKKGLVVKSDERREQLEIDDRELRKRNWEGMEGEWKGERNREILFSRDQSKRVALGMTIWASNMPDALQSRFANAAPIVYALYVCIHMYINTTHHILPYYTMPRTLIVSVPTYHALRQPDV